MRRYSILSNSFRRLVILALGAAMFWQCSRPEVEPVEQSEAAKLLTRGNVGNWAIVSIEEADTLVTAKCRLDDGYTFRANGSFYFQNKTVCQSPEPDSYLGQWRLTKGDSFLTIEAAAFGAQYWVVALNDTLLDLKTESDSTERRIRFAPKK